MFSALCQHNVSGNKCWEVGVLCHQQPSFEMEWPSRNSKRMKYNVGKLPAAAHWSGIMKTWHLNCKHFSFKQTLRKSAAAIQSFQPFYQVTKVTPSAFSTPSFCTVSLTHTERHKTSTYWAKHTFLTLSITVLIYFNFSHYPWVNQKWTLWMSRKSLSVSYVTYKILSGAHNEGGCKETVVADGWHCLRYYMPSNLASVWVQAWQMCWDVAVVEIEMEHRSVSHSLLPSIHPPLNLQ